MITFFTHFLFVSHSRLSIRQDSLIAADAGFVVVFSACFVIFTADWIREQYSSFFLLLLKEHIKYGQEFLF